MTNNILAHLDGFAHTKVVQLPTVPDTDTVNLRAELSADVDIFMHQTARHLATLSQCFDLLRGIISELRTQREPITEQLFYTRIAVIMEANPILEAWLEYEREEGHVIENLAESLGLNEE